MVRRSIKFGFVAYDSIGARLRTAKEASKLLEELRNAYQSVAPEEKRRVKSFITGHGDIPMSVRAMKAGAVEFLTKPFRDQDLLMPFASRWSGIVPGVKMKKR